jgi:hypothetical protein
MPRRGIVALLQLSQNEQVCGAANGVDVEARRIEG